MVVVSQILLKGGEVSNFDILKSDDLVIGGYASIEMVDKQNDLITLEALNEAVEKFMDGKKYRNVMSNHSNVQVGEVIDNYRDKNGVLHKTKVDDVGFYVVIKLRDDIEKAKEISRGIRKGTLRSFSIGGQAISKKSKNSDEYGQYNEIDRLELHEVTICEKGINPEAKFDILKQERGEKISEELSAAISELNDLMKQVNSLHKEEEMMDDGMGKEDEEVEAMYMKEDEEMMDKGDDEELKALADGGDETDANDKHAGELVVDNGNAKTQPATKHLAKGVENEEFSTLDLSPENVEKAYAQFRAEQLEKIAYDSLSKQFEERFAAELEVKKADAEKAEYDAQTEVATLRQEFAELRKSLTETNEIAKSEGVSLTLPEGFPTSADEIQNMSWGDIHNVVRGFN